MMTLPDPYKELEPSRDAERVTNAGIDMILGGRRVIFKMLPISQDIEWRRAMAEVYAGIARAEKSDEIGTIAIVNYLATDGMDRLVDACFMLAPTVDKSSIIERATRAELAAMCCRVMEEFYCPFVRCCLELYRVAVPR